MSTPEYALILPISDIEMRRDQGRKLRIAGHVTSIDPAMPTTVVLSEVDQGASILVDMSLCTNPEPNDDPHSRANAGGWRLYRTQQQRQQIGASTVIPPALKSICMVIGHLRKASTPIDISFVQQLDSPSRDPQNSHTSSVRQGRPNKRYIFEAILVKELDHTFDLPLWNYTARLRSQQEWKDKQ